MTRAGNALLVGLLTAICIGCVSTFIMLATLQRTLLDRDTTKGWLRESNTYQHVAAAIAQNAAISDNSLIDNGAVQNAAEKTFTPQFAQTYTEQALDGYYDWIEGRSAAPNLALPLGQIEPELTANLAAEVRSKLAALPQCASSADFDANNPQCVPQGLDISQTADQWAAQTVGNSQLDAGSPPGNPAAAQGQAIANPASGLKSMADRMRLWVTLAPVIAVLSAVVIFAVAASRLRALMRLSIKVLLTAALTLVVGLALVYYGQAASLDYITADQQAAVRRILEPLIQAAAPDIGRQLAVMSGSVAAVAAVTWVVAFFVRQRWYPEPKAPAKTQA